MVDAARRSLGNPDDVAAFVKTALEETGAHVDATADGLVAEMMQRLAKVFADERSKLEEQWSRGDDISTEDLRVALRRYRSFMDRLLSV